MLRRTRTAITLLSLLSILLLTAPLTLAGQPLPFKGSSSQQAISAVPVDDTTLFVTTVGGGTATHPPRPKRCIRQAGTRARALVAHAYGPIRRGPTRPRPAS